MSDGIKRTLTAGPTLAETRRSRRRHEQTALITDRSSDLLGWAFVSLLVGVAYGAAPFLAGNDELEARTPSWVLLALGIGAVAFLTSMVLGTLGLARRSRTRARKPEGPRCVDLDRHRRLVTRWRAMCGDRPHRNRADPPFRFRPPEGRRWGGGA
jgi:hypothetical protein